MGLFDRFRRRSGARRGGGAARSSASLDHLRSWAADREGVEAWLEPATTIGPASILLVAHDGEWTRRSIPATKQGRALAKELKLPVYQAGVVPYPQRMRDWNNRHGKGA